MLIDNLLSPALEKKNVETIQRKCHRFLCHMNLETYFDICMRGGTPLTHSRPSFSHEKSGARPQKRLSKTLEIIDFLAQICYTINTKIKRVTLEKIKSAPLKNPVISTDCAGAAEVWYRA